MELNLTGVNNKGSEDVATGAHDAKWQPSNADPDGIHLRRLLHSSPDLKGELTGIRSDGLATQNVALSWKGRLFF